MLTRIMHIRGLSRLMAGLFAMQIVVGGFCLLTAEAHEIVPLAMAGTSDGDSPNSGIDGHCGKSVDSGSQRHHESDHSGNCSHCDHPDELSSSVVSGLSLALVLADIIVLPSACEGERSASGLLSTRTPTGPPSSSTLLYTTTQRIRI